MIEISHALIVRAPYAQMIVQGRKKWEMRARSTRIRGPIAVMEAGANTILGIARLIDVGEQLSAEQYGEAAKFHCIPEDMVPQALASGWTIPWVIGEAQVLPCPLSCPPRPGAVIWYKLGESQRYALSCALDGGANESQALDALAPGRSADAPPPESLPDMGERTPEILVPFAADGTWFGPHLARSGNFTVGAKGAERKYMYFEKALSYLRSLPVARWRRPNREGNWGIVSAVEWKPLPR